MVSKHSPPSRAISNILPCPKKDTIEFLIWNNGGTYQFSVDSDEGRITHLITTLTAMRKVSIKGKTSNSLLVQLHMAYHFSWRTR